VAGQPGDDRERVGRRNRYVVVSNGRFRHPLEQHVRVGDFLDLVRDGAEESDQVTVARSAGERA
jgi:hypothetical protein